MKWITVFALLTVMAVVNQQGSSTPTSHAADEQAIRELNDQWLKAFDVGDAGTLDRIEGDDFTVAGEFGESTKQEQLDGVRHRTEKGPTVTRKIENQQFRFYSETALVTEIDHASCTGSANEDQTTTLWVRRGGDWKVVHLHFTELAKK